VSTAPARAPVERTCAGCGTPFPAYRTERFCSPRCAGRSRRPGHPAAKLTTEIVADARRRFRAGESIAALARAAGVSESTMRRAVRGEGWRHVDLPPVGGETR
jgi:hypothetical protein